MLYSWFHSTCIHLHVDPTHRPLSRGGALFGMDVRFYLGHTASGPSCSVVSWGALVGCPWLLTTGGSVWCYSLLNIKPTSCNSCPHTQTNTWNRADIVILSMFNRLWCWSPRLHITAFVILISLVVDIYSVHAVYQKHAWIISTKNISLWHCFMLITAVLCELIAKRTSGPQGSSGWRLLDWL